MTNMATEIAVVTGLLLNRAEFRLGEVLVPAP